MSARTVAVFGVSFAFGSAAYHGVTLAMAGCVVAFVALQFVRTVQR